MTQWDDPGNEPTRRYAPPEYGQPQYGQPQYGQPQYGQPQYGQPQYGQPEYGQPRHRQAPYGQRPGYGQMNPWGPESDQAFGIVGTVLALLGGVMLVVAFTAVDWFRNSVSFSDVGNHVDHPNANAFATAYFGWLAWVFLIVTVLAGVLASFPSPAVRALRIIGVVVGVAAAGLSFLAINLYGAPYTTYLSHARIGFYLAVIGYLVSGIGAGIGPRRV